MGSNLGKFLQEFSNQKDNGEDKIDNLLKEEFNKVQQGTEINPLENKGLIRPVERIRRKEPTNVNLETSKQEINSKKLKLNLKKQSQQNEESTSSELLNTEVNNVYKNDEVKSLDQQNVKNEVKELDDLEALFEKTDTPLEQKEKWMITIQTARKSNAKTIFNTKVCNGRFRFTSVGQLEILPDMDTSGKSSKELLSMKWK